MKVLPPPGIITLDQKQDPISLREIRPDYPLIVTRDEIDITPFKQKLLSLPSEVWDDENQDGNVKLTRPAHDKWGIKKIVFTFCDDFMMKVLDLPWSKDESWSALLDPIYERIGVDKSKIVRCLLASMPPGVIIPVHHDTGHWVKHTHRVHVPIISGPELEFFVGPDESSMLSYEVNEGRIIELNNQAKHAVTNNLTYNRVHLIFDYVDDYPLTRYSLQPGQILHQTRRSIDFDPNDPKCDPSYLSTQHEPLPTYIIIGAQKCGTTSLYEYISQHPLVLKGKRRETHYFDWRWNPQLQTPQEHQQYYMNFYHGDVLKKHPSIITGESTPSYLLHSNIVIPRLKMVLPSSSLRLLVMLRNPVSRAYSQFQMAIDASGTQEQMKTRGMSSYANKTFEEIIETEIKQCEDNGINPDVSYEIFERTLLTSLPMNHGGHSIILRGLYALQLIPWLENFPEQIKILSISEIKGTKQQIQQTLNSVFEFISLPPSDIEDVEPKNARNYSEMSPQARARLEEFYAPYNEKLFSLLGRRLEW